MKPDWFLTANATIARIYQSERGRKLKLVEAFEHPAGRMKSSELSAERSGHDTTARGLGGVPYAKRSDPHRKEHLRFARELAQYVERAALNGTFDSLHVFASHPFLGELKAEMGEAGRRHLVATHGVDLTPVGPAEIDKRIRHELAQPR
jgi:protein required for attachment to host cells